MSNCANCNKQFTCGCQKATIGNGIIVCKECKTKADANVYAQSNLNRELARQQIQNLRNK